MTDHELLEAAAKAAEITIKWFEETDEPWCFIPDRHPPHNRRENDKISGAIWNPLTDDGDALRLAVKLDMGVEVMLSLNETRAGDGDQEQVTERHNGDPYAATRRAIVRAAAVIGDAT